MQALEADPEIQQNFSAFPELYQQIKIDNIQRYGADVELFERRLEKLLTNTKANQPSAFFLSSRWHSSCR
ncbi:YdeI/OmpD-associated family protein [Enterococcus avium]